MKSRQLPRTVVKVDQLRSILVEKIKSGELAPGSNLPPMRKLASLFEVSMGTVQRCFKILEKEGMIMTRPQSGVFIAGESTQPRPPDARMNIVHKSKADLIADSIIREISNGSIQVGSPLPMQKALRFQYGTTHSTLKSALSLLLRKGLVHLKGNTFFAGPPESRRHHRDLKVYFLPAKSWVTGRIVPFRQIGRLRYPMEQELAEFGVSLAPRTEGVIGKRKDCLGFCYTAGGDHWAGNIAGGNRKLMEKEMLRISQFGHRVAILSAGGIQSRFPGFPFRKFPKILALGLDSLQAGEDTGKYLATMGHRNVAFFSYSSENWNALRSEGLGNGLKRAFGNEAAVILMSAEARPGELMNSIAINSNRMAETTRALIAQVSRKKESAPPDLAHALITTVQNHIARENHFVILRPFFDQALKNKSITAWVGADATVAVAAARFLKEKGIRIPEELSVMGIHDRVELADAGITGLDNQLGRHAYLAAHWLLGDIPVRRNRQGIVVCPSRVVDRGSVGRV